MPHTIRLHRVLKSKPDRVYRAFSDADAMVKWLPPHGFVGQVHENDARVGGVYRMSFVNFASGNAHSWAGRYVELVPDRRVVTAATFDDPNLTGEMRTTVEIVPVFCGVELTVTQEGIPDAIPPQACYLGWQESLQLLALLDRKSVV